MSRQLKMSLIVLAGAVLIAALMIALRGEPEEQRRDTSDPLVKGIAFEVATDPLEVFGSGTVQAREEVDVGAEVSGRLVYVNPGFREGGLVGKGATLFRVDAADYRNRMRSAQADVAAQSVSVLQAQEEARIARQELERYAGRAGRDLLAETIDEGDYASRILPPRELQDEATRARGSASRSPAPNRLATREPQLRSARAARERASAQLADAQLAFNRTTVRAPFSGLVRSETAAVGTLVQPGQKLGSIVSTAAFEVRVSLTEGEAALIPGLLQSGRSRIPAQVFFDYGGLTWRWSAWVDRADAILDEQTRTIDVFLYVPSPLRSGVKASEGDAGETRGSAAPPLLLGSFVNARIVGASPVPFAKVPASALRPGNQVWVVRGGKLRILPVRVIQRTDNVAYVTTGSIAQGGLLVTSSLRAPVDGMAVRIEKPRAKTRRKAASKATTNE